MPVEGQNSKLVELSSKFDLYYNNISSNQAPGLVEYEKSVFLTNAQEDIVLSLYNGRNVSGESFEETEELRRYLSNLIVEDNLSLLTNTSGSHIGMEGSNSYFFSLPDGSEEGKPAVWHITYESVNVNAGEGKCGGNKQIEVVPIRQDEYHKLKHNPFRGLNDRKAFRLDLADNVVEIVSKYPVNSYYLRYLKRPYPIILENLTDELNINGYTEAREPLDVSEFLHQRIIEAAVELALKSWKS